MRNVAAAVAQRGQAIIETTIALRSTACCLDGSAMPTTRNQNRRLTSKALECWTRASNETQADIGNARTTTNVENAEAIAAIGNRSHGKIRQLGTEGDIEKREGGAASTEPAQADIREVITAR